MKAQITLVVREIQLLDGVQLARLTEMLVNALNALPFTGYDFMSVTTATDEPVAVVEAIEALQVTIAHRLDHRLWMSVSLDYPAQP